jgi:hypothetical protein
MSEAIVITPVKDSPVTTQKTIEAVCQSECLLDYYVFNDFSGEQTNNLLTKLQKKWKFHLIHLQDFTDHQSPNYNLVLLMAQNIAIEKQKPLIIVESDVVVNPGTISALLKISENLHRPGLVGAITIDSAGKYNFPYNFEKTKNNQIIDTHKSLSFCCTLITLPFLESFSFNGLSQKKDWFDVTISRQAKKNGFHNYLAKGVEVLHLPHSSRPWKNLKYRNPVLYYLKKIIQKRDRI